MDRVQIGMAVILDNQHAVIADAIETENTPKIAVPRGAKITQIAQAPVNSFNDLANELKRHQGQTVSLSYEYNGETNTLTVDLPASAQAIAVNPIVQISLPLELMKEKYQTSNPVQAMFWGLKKTKAFIMQTLLTLRGLFGGSVSADTLMGPVGIVTASYKIAQKSLIEYLYFLGLISSCIAVMNLLPFPIVDGGVIVTLLIEKVKGSPINEKVQEGISYAGLVLIISVFVWLTYNDILRAIFQ
jgi:regulator of sigma E protease